ncbi:hypothetical protein DA718_05665 [Klebsiella huaxiensis]|nr:hypothetical protein DA718_05665 [Klebsiella huaxiensis]
MLRICPGYHPADGGYPVARAGALRRPREQSAEGQNFPEAMLRICPGYHPADSGKPVAQWRILPTDGGKPVAQWRILPTDGGKPVARLAHPAHKAASNTGRTKRHAAIRQPGENVLLGFILRYVIRRF